MPFGSRNCPGDRAASRQHHIISGQVEARIDVPGRCHHLLRDRDGTFDARLADIGAIADGEGASEVEGVHLF